MPLEGNQLRKRYSSREKVPDLRSASNGWGVKEFPNFFRQERNPNPNFLVRISSGGIASVVRWNLRPVIFGVEYSPRGAF